jgi:hypothetical protein
LAARKVPVLFFILLASACRTAAQQPPGCAQDFFCLFNQEAAATGPGEIHRFSHDLVELIVPEEAGKDYINSLSDRLASAELAARNGRGKLIPEANVVRSFNELMRTIGAPPTFTADAASLRGFRARSATVLSLSALFTANRNGTNCDPGEAVLLLFLLIENDGGLSEHLFDEYEPPQAGGREKRSSVLVFGGGESLNMHAKGMLSEYSSKHRRHTTIKLLNRAAQTLGF